MFDAGERDDHKRKRKITTFFKSVKRPGEIYQQMYEREIRTKHSPKFLECKAVDPQGKN